MDSALRQGIRAEVLAHGAARAVRVLGVAREAGRPDAQNSLVYRRRTFAHPGLALLTQCGASGALSGTAGRSLRSSTPNARVRSVRPGCGACSLRPLCVRSAAADAFAERCGTVHGSADATAGGIGGGARTKLRARTLVFNPLFRIFAPKTDFRRRITIKRYTTCT